MMQSLDLETGTKNEKKTHPETKRRRARKQTSKPSTKDIIVYNAYPTRRSEGARTRNYKNCIQCKKARKKVSIQSWSTFWFPIILVLRWVLLLYSDLPHPFSSGWSLFHHLNISWYLLPINSGCMLCLWHVFLADWQWVANFLTGRSWWSKVKSIISRSGALHFGFFQGWVTRQNTIRVSSIPYARVLYHLIMKSQLIMSTYE